VKYVRRHIFVLSSGVLHYVLVESFIRNLFDKGRFIGNWDDVRRFQFVSMWMGRESPDEANRSIWLSHGRL